MKKTVITTTVQELRLFHICEIKIYIKQEKRVNDIFQEAKDTYSTVQANISTRVTTTHAHFMVEVVCCKQRVNENKLVKPIFFNVCRLVTTLTQRRPQWCPRKPITRRFLVRKYGTMGQYLDFAWRKSSTMFWPFPISKHETCFPRNNFCFCLKTYQYNPGIVSHFVFGNICTQLYTSSCWLLSKRR